MDICADILQVETAIFAMSSKKPSSNVPVEFDTSSCQLDLVFALPLNIHKHAGCWNLLLPPAHAEYPNVILES